MSEMLEQVGTLHEEMKGVAAAKAEDLPQGSEPVVEEPAKEEAPLEAAEVAADAPPAKEEPETLIRIGSQTFKSQAEAIRYAEQLEQEKLITEAYNQGIREAIQSQAPQQEIPQEDNFEEEFYSNPKATLSKLKDQAKAEALAAVEAERRKESLWKSFEEKYPDIDRKDAELILAQNMDTVGKMTNIDKAFEVLAQKTRAEYQRILDRVKPRTELPPSRGQSVVPATSAQRSVTPQKKEEPVLTLSQQMSMLRKQQRTAP